MEQAKFSFKGFRVVDAELHFAKVTDNLNLQFYPEGVFDADNHQYHLHLSFRAINDNSENDVIVQLESIALFQMEDTVTKLEEKKATLPHTGVAEYVGIVFVAFAIVGSIIFYKRYKKWQGV
jgi:hypothetical protein